MLSETYYAQNYASKIGLSIGENLIRKEQSSSGCPSEEVSVMVFNHVVNCSSNAIIEGEPDNFATESGFHCAIC